MSFVETVVKNPVKVTVGVILLSLFGTLAAIRMPLQLTPEVQIPTLTVETIWPGASAQEVEREIVLEQEEQLQSVEGVRKLSSESMDSLGRITLEFAIGIDMSKALNLVNTRLQQVREYPENAEEPVVSTSNSSNTPIAWFILTPQPPETALLEKLATEFPAHKDRLLAIARHPHVGIKLYRLSKLRQDAPELAGQLPPELDVTKQRRFAKDYIEARFERVDGVSNSNVLGGREDEMQVIVDPERLAARQLTIMDVRAALRGNNKDTSGGDFWEGKRRYVVRTLGQFRTPEQVSNSIIASRDGVQVFVRDVAEVRLGFKKPDGIVRRFGTEVIAINCIRETGANVLDVMAGLREATAELNSGVLAQRGLHLSQVYDETEYIYAALGLVKDNVVEGALLTFVVLMVFLRSWRSALIVFVAIVVSMVGMFLVMNQLGRSLNVPSLAGIAFAVGMLVDNFIVVLENIHRHHSEGEDRLTATVNGTREVWGAIIAATLANLAVFIPVLFVEDEAGQLFRDIAIATSSAVALSLLVALIVVPTAVFRILPRDQNAEGSVPAAGNTNAKSSWFSKGSMAVSRLVWPLDAAGQWLAALVTTLNAWMLKGVLRRLVAVAVLVGFSAYGSYLLLPKVEYLPQGNRNLVFGILLPPPGYNILQMQAMGEVIESELRPYWDVEPGTPEFNNLKYPPIENLFYVARGRLLFMGARAYDPMRAGELVELFGQIRSKLPGTFLIAKQSSLFEQGFSAGRTIEVEIAGPDMVRLVGLGMQVLGQAMQKIPGCQARPIPSLDLSSPEMHIAPKWEQAADMGVTASDLGYTVDALIDGAYASDYYFNGDKIDLSIVGDSQFAQRTQDLERLAIATPQGNLVPLTAVADVRYESGPEQINRRERQRAITIEVTPPASMPLEQAMDILRDDVLAGMKGAGAFEGLTDPRLSGTADKLKTAWASLKWNLLLALVITYLLMAALFESWLYPAIIILSVPLGAVGGFGGLWVLNQFILPAGMIQPLDVLTMLGFIILVGTVVNNPILIVEQALVLIREQQLSPREAILESVRTRIRPIFMTALIGFFGLLPLVIDPGAGSELYRGMGSVLLGGLLVSTVFTLILVPALFSLTKDAEGWIANRFGRKATTKLALSVDTGNTLQVNSAQ